MRKAVLLMLLVMAGCATKPEPVVKPVEVAVPLIVHCDPKLGPEPVYPDTPAALAAVPHPAAAARLVANPLDPVALIEVLDNIGYQLKLLLKGRAMRIQRDGEKSAAIEGCK